MCDIIAAGGVSKPSTSTPGEAISSLVEKFIGPRMRSRPRARSHSAAASSSARATAGSSSLSKRPKKPRRSPWYWLWSWLSIAAMRPTGRPSRSATK